MKKVIMVLSIILVWVGFLALVTCIYPEVEKYGQSVLQYNANTLSYEIFVDGKTVPVTKLLGFGEEMSDNMQVSYIKHSGDEKYSVCAGYAEKQALSREVRLKNFLKLFGVSSLLLLIYVGLNILCKPTLQEIQIVHADE